MGESESELTMYQGYSTFIQSMNIDTRDSRKVMEGHPHGSAQEHFRLKANLLRRRAWQVCKHAAPLASVRFSFRREA